MSDNVLQDGNLIESRFAVERRDRTIHSRMREYLYTLKHHQKLETSILPLGDGVALSVKKNEERKRMRSGISPELLIPAEQPGGFEDCSGLRGRCSIYWRGGLWTSGKGKKFFAG